MVSSRKSYALRRWHLTAALAAAAYGGLASSSLAASRPRVATASSHNGWDTVWKTLASAAVGAVLALAGDRVLEALRERRTFKASLRLILEEITVIETEAAIRAVPADGGSIRDDAPLPTQAWRTLVASGAASRVKALGALVDLYRAVEGANYLAGQVPLYLQTANLAADSDVQDVFAAEAARLSTQPFAELGPRVKPARSAVQAHL